MDQPKKKILVVDDTEATRYAVARTLRAEGYLTIEAASGREALKLVESELPDLVTLDIHLPDMLGFDVCRKIKLNPGTRHIPVLQVSASYITSTDRIHGLEGGADAYLVHPFEPAVLNATVLALLRSRELHDDLRLEKEKFRVALKYAPITIYTTDLHLKYTWIYNPPQGMEGLDFIGRDDRDIYGAEEAASLMEIKKDVLAANTGKRVTRSLGHGSRARFYDMTLEPLQGPDSKVTGLTVACIDVTDRLRSEAEQKRAYEEAELANRAKTRFLSNMSHEIRTPLGVIQGFADLALDPELDATIRDEYLSIIKRNAQNLTKLLGEILDLAKVEAGRMELEKTRFSITSLLTEVTDALSLQAREKGISLIVNFEDPFPDLIESDITRTRQILINLISNALKFTQRGGVQIIGRVGEALEENSEENSFVQIQIQVVDTGIGITEEQKERLFEAFMQADTSTTRKFGGTGLGLNLSKKLAQSLGGDVTLLRSEPLQGSNFLFSLLAPVFSYRDPDANPDLRPFENKHTSVSAAPSERAIQGMRILLVEDSIDNQVLLTSYLKNAGASLVDLANDGFEGIEKAKQISYDVILMDVQMPNLDGLEATRKLRDCGVDVPIVGLTAHALKEDRERALRQGFTQYLTKPLNAPLLIEVLKSLRKF